MMAIPSHPGLHTVAVCNLFWFVGELSIISLAFHLLTELIISQRIEVRNFPLDAV